MSVFGIFSELHKPDKDYLSQSHQEADHKERIVAFFIGLLAIGLAVGVNVLDIQNGSQCARSSISHYFFEPWAGPFFVIVLAFVGAFLFRYRGENIWDGRIASAAGFLALFVAFFPTGSESTCTGAMMDFRVYVTAQVENGVIQTTDIDGGTFLKIESAEALFMSGLPTRIHWWSAVALLLVLFYFSAFVFTRVRDDKDKEDGRIKRIKLARNTAYLATSFGMLVGFALVLFQDYFSSVGLPRPVFWGEAVALASFGVAWLVKGRFFFWSGGAGLS